MAFPSAECSAFLVPDHPGYAVEHLGDGQRAGGGLDSVERYADFAESCQAAGIPAFKIRGFFDGNPNNEIAIMSAVRERVGEDMKLTTDPASSLKSFMDAVEVGRACDDLGFFWYEDPYRMHRRVPSPTKRLRGLVRTPLLTAVGQDGCVPGPAGPGLGVSYDLDRIDSGEAGRVAIR